MLRSFVFFLSLLFMLVLIVSSGVLRRCLPSSQVNFHLYIYIVFIHNVHNIRNVILRHSMFNRGTYIISTDYNSPMFPNWSCEETTWAEGSLVDTWCEIQPHSGFPSSRNIIYICVQYITYNPTLRMIHTHRIILT